MEAIRSESYSVFFDTDLEELKNYLQKNHYSKVFVLIDRNTERYCLPILQEKVLNDISVDLIEIDPGEENKNIDFCIGIWQTLLDFGADRTSLLINLGGGVVTDMGGFAASTYKRGIDFIQIPTTLLSQVDAAIGGKTGVDLGNVKNIIGTFTQPKAVYIHHQFLKTQDRRQLISGFAEVVKHGLIYDDAYYNALKEHGIDHLDEKIIYRSVEIKNEVVSSDPKEAGLRKILNFGHTIGHAIEGYSLKHDSAPLLHGEAIAIGMICEGYLSSQINGLKADELQDIITFIRKVFPDYTLKASTFPELMEIMKNDKKNADGNIGFSLLLKIGKCDFNHYVNEEQIASSLLFYAELVNG